MKITKNNLLKKWISAAAVPSLLMAVSSIVYGASNVQGSVVDSSGVPATGVSVMFSRVASLQVVPQANAVSAQADPSYSGQASPNQSGAFSAQNLPAGDYYVCVSAAPGSYVDGCKWNGVQRVSLLDNATLANLQLVVSKGAQVRVHLQDPLNLVPSPGTPISGPKVIVGVQTSRGNIQVADFVAKTTAGWDLAITVPTNMPLKLWLFSRELTVADQKGAPLNTSGPASGISFAPGTDGTDVTLRITGRAKPQP
jgi:hypothetical protein